MRGSDRWSFSNPLDIECAWLALYLIIFPMIIIERSGYIINNRLPNLMSVV
jgi:hypothetical protein